MATKVVTGKVTAPDGSGKANVVVRASLSQGAVVSGTSEVPPLTVSATSASDGTYSLTLQANNDLTPTGTYYQIDEAGYSYSIVVPQSAGPFIISTIQVSVPPVASPTPSHVTSLVVDTSATVGGLLHAGTLTVDTGPLTLPAASIADSALSTNVDLLNANQTLTGVKSANDVRFGGHPLYDVTHATYGCTVGAADNQTGINQAITDANAAGGGYVLLPGLFTASTITLKSGVRLVATPGGGLKLKNSTNADLISLAAGVHSNTAILGLYLDGNGANQTTGNVIGIAGAGGTLGNLEIIGNTLINAPIHGMYIAEATPALPIVSKVIRDNVVNDHGIAGVGYGIYLDWAAPAIIEGNWVYSHNQNDNIELGHTSHGDPNYCYQCIGNVVVGGQLQFPFAHGAQIIGNLVVNSNIQNDTNSANYVLIEANTVLNAASASGYSGINVAGTKAIIKGNRVQITGAANVFGVGTNAQTLSDSIIEGNLVETLAAAPTGTAIACGTGAGSTGNQIINNTIFGQWNRGIQVTGANNSIRGNVLDLTAAVAATGILLVPSATSGVLANNCDVVGNQILGSPTTPLDLTGTGNNITGTIAYGNQGGGSQDFPITGNLTMSTAASRIVPGATSLSLRNNANNADNLFVSNAGLVTVRAGLTVTASDFTLTAGRVIFGAAASQIQPGATSLAFTNNAFSANNLVIADNGVVTISRAALAFGAAVSQINPGATSFAITNNAASASNLLITDAGVVTLHNKLYPATDGAATQSASALYAGTGVPNNANGANGDFYFRSDGGAGTALYQRRAGAWVATAA